MPGNAGGSGRPGRRGTLEKHVTLTIARKLKSLIDAEPKMRAMLTRDGDYVIELKARVEKARLVKADLFVSSTPTLSSSPTFVARRYLRSRNVVLEHRSPVVGERREQADLIGGINTTRKRDRYLEMTLNDLSLTAQVNDSLKPCSRCAGGTGRREPLHKGTSSRRALRC